MHVKEIYVIFFHLFDSGLLIIDLNKKKGKRGLGEFQDKNTSRKLPLGVSPLQLVNLHRNRSVAAYSGLGKYLPDSEYQLID
jgi:hypothetical protein